MSGGAPRRHDSAGGRVPQIEKIGQSGLAVGADAALIFTMDRKAMLPACMRVPPMPEVKLDLHIRYKHRRRPGTTNAFVTVSGAVGGWIYTFEAIAGGTR